ncbi:AbrB/MazE/SpoVT family DNA-binding domain-containing protein [archaeon]|jgi:phosphate uptake regulator|nr:AbrB/MazE/SpoVT family DNA-binding domain-containing protein [archaeon]
MKRKIIKQGHNTLTMTLPAEWSKKLNLKAGDEVDLVEDSGSLIINGKQNNGFKSTTIDITGLSVPMLWRFFQSAYREGYDEIKLKYDPNINDYDGVYNFYVNRFGYSQEKEGQTKKSVLDMISELVNRFIGMEVIDCGEGYCVIREMGDISSKEFDNSLRRIFLLILDLFDKMIDLIGKNKIGDMGICKTLYTMDINVDRFIDYCCRINNKIRDSSFQKNKPVMFSTLYIMELLGDEFKYMGTHLARSKKKVDEILDFAEKVKDHFEMYYHLFYKFDREKVIKFGENDFNIYNDHSKRNVSKNKDVQSLRSHLMQVSKFTFVLMELRIEMEF